MKVFCTGASGYIGGSVAAHLVAAGHHVTGLVRSLEKADAVRIHGIQPLFGTLDDEECLVQAAQAADIVINAASADHKGAVVALTGALAGTGKLFIHTSGSSIVGTRAKGHRSDEIFDEDAPITASPARAARVALNEYILSHREKGSHPVIICPSLIYGLGHGAEPHSMQVPLLIALARKRGCAAHAGPGENVWSNVHIDDLVTLYALAIEKAPAGAFYFAENGENSMCEICEAINTMLGFDRPPSAMSMEEAASEWGEGVAEDTMGSNSRVRGVRARRQLDWEPKARDLLEEIEQGCYR
ncbi:NAD-dependent epimerase/dehydratase family protein [Bradyrhizobium neotropicale]|uniref:NAD-dependent epimerase/dehydratase family protein n=1 Tax=Bradyrhizobium neotropicale TaxID=1497615 RepID=UPI001AD66233|nr:NAD-dependent epimerase/dehydratase family protein [Bradyrhizobium neotropicale]MBO4222107.1 NAD-dependent epimerase/dehydratase family protein [Bradyrhizobium neotropicale]